MDKTDRLRDYGLAFLLYEQGLGVCGYELIRELFIFVKLILNSYLEARELYLQDVILNGKRYDRYVDDFINSHRYINCNSAICRNCHEMNIHIVKGLLNECAHLIQPLFEASDFSFEKCMELQRKYDRSEPLPPYSWHGARGLLCMASATSWVPLSQEIRIPGHTSM